MSLLYDANGDILTSGSVTPPTVGTATWWVKLSSASRQMVPWGTFAGASYLGTDFEFGSAGAPIYCVRQRGTTDIEVRADSGNFAAFGTGKWIFVAFVWDSGGAASGQKLFVGDETTAPAQPSAYTLQAVGSGASDTTAGTVYIGNASYDTTLWVDGRMGGFALYSRALSDADIAAAWAASSPTGANCQIYYRLGSNGTTNVPDESGNGNTGTITGLSSADSLPVVLFGRSARARNHYHRRRT